MEDNVIDKTKDIQDHLNRCSKLLVFAKENKWTDDDIKRVVCELFYQYEMPYKQPYNYR